MNRVQKEFKVGDKKGQGYSSVVQHLPGLCEAWVLSPEPQKENKINKN